MLDAIPWGVVIGSAAVRTQVTEALIDGIPVSWSLAINGGAVGMLGTVFLMVMYGKLGTPGHMKALIDQIADKTKTIQDQSKTINEQRDMLVKLVQTTQTIEHVGSVVEHTMTTISDQKAGE